MIYKSLYNIYTKSKKIDLEYKSIVNNPNFKSQEYLNSLISFSTNEIEYYSQFKNFTYQDMPILTKDIIRSEFEQLQRKNLKNFKVNTSGGSTGEPVKFIQDSTYDKFVGYGIKYFYNELLGMKIAPMKKIMLWGSEKDLLNWSGDWKRKLKNKIYRTHYLNSFMIDDNKLKKFVHEMNFIKPEYIRGYATTLYELAKFIEINKINIKFKPKLIVSSAETLQDNMRFKIESIFQCQVYDFYGSRETGAIAGQCKYGKYHFFSFNQYPELVNLNNNMYQLLISTLHNYSMPLIKFDIGDIVIKNDTSQYCKCGSPLPFVDKIQGRISDNFITTDNKIVHGEYFTHLFYGKEYIKKFQVIQKDYDRINFHIELNENIKIENFETEIIKNTKVVMGNDTNINFIYEKIKPTINGKFLYTKSEVYTK